MTCVQVYARDGRRLFDTANGGKVRQLLKTRRARVVQRTPFAIQLKYDPKEPVRSDEEIPWPDLMQARPIKPITTT